MTRPRTRPGPAAARRALPAVAALLTALLAAGLAPACFRHVTEQRQLPNVAYLTFSEIDGTAAVRAAGPRRYEFELRSPGDKAFAVEAGRYRVTVTRGSELLVDRIVFVAAGETMDVTR